MNSILKNPSTYDTNLANLKTLQENQENTIILVTDGSYGKMGNTHFGCFRYCAYNILGFLMR